MDVNLQQGDWLIPYNCEEPHRVKEISYQEDRAGRWTVITFEGAGVTGVWYYPSYCKPVPLTAEILEKNCFERYEVGGGRVDMWTGFGEDNQYDIEVEFREDGSIFTKIDGPTYLCSPAIHNVHELQHALSICGINKEIKLED